jgi:hypothetical protein
MRSFLADTLSARKDFPCPLSFFPIAGKFSFAKEGSRHVQAF